MSWVDSFTSCDGGKIDDWYIITFYILLKKVILEIVMNENN